MRWRSASLVLRWLAPHLATGVRPSPLADLVAGLYAMPGSLSATGSAPPPPNTA